ncbi:unnamed protein product, partial [Ixodes persulcatus]
LLLILEGHYSKFVKNEGVVWSDCEGLVEEAFGQLRVVRQAVLKTNVEEGELTPSSTGAL